MSDVKKLTKDEIAAARPQLPGWTFGEDHIDRSFKLKDFSEAFALMCRIAMLAEKHDHHPEWRNVYNTLDVRLSTHDVGGLSARDIGMARAIDKLLPAAS